MKKVTSIVLASLLMLTLVLSGCAKTAAPTATATPDATQATEVPKATAAPVEKTIILKVNYPTDPANPNSVAIFKSLKAKFNEKYPNIQIVNIVTAGAELLNKASDLIKLEAAGNAPDAVRLAATEATLVSNKGLVIDLTSKINDWSFKNNINSSAYGYMSTGGKIYGIPSDGYGHVLMYNKKIFADLGIAAPPKTWDELVADATKAKAAGKIGFAMISKDFFAGWLTALPFVWQAGGDFETISGNTAKAVFNSPEAMKAWQFIYDLKWKYNVLQKDVLYDVGTMMKDFIAGNTAMTVQWDPHAEAYVNAGMNKDDVGFAPLPAGPGGEATLMGGSFWGVNAASTPEVQDAAWKFISWLTESYLADPNVVKDSISKLSANLKPGQIAATTPSYSIFTGDIASAIAQVYKDNANVSYILSDDITKQIIEKGHPEPAYSTQQLYAEFFPQIVQQIVSDKNINLQKVVDDAAQKFQTKYLDTIQ